MPFSRQVIQRERQTEFRPSVPDTFYLPVFQRVCPIRAADSQQQDMMSGSGVALHSRRNFDHLAQSDVIGSGQSQAGDLVWQQSQHRSVARYQADPAFVGMPQILASPDVVEMSGLKKLDFSRGGVFPQIIPAKAFPGLPRPEPAMAQTAVAGLAEGCLARCSGRTAKPFPELPLPGHPAVP